jgi:glycine cleavage system protein P-like pyridoxal-binding family
VQTPDAKGIVHDFTQFFNKIDESQSRVIKVVASDLLALTLTKAPGDMGADVCFGSAQRFGVPMGFGGPYSGFFSTRESSGVRSTRTTKWPTEWLCKQDSSTSEGKRRLLTSALLKLCLPTLLPCTQSTTALKD